MLTIVRVIGEVEVIAERMDVGRLFCKCGQFAQSKEALSKVGLMLDARLAEGGRGIIEGGAKFATLCLSYGLTSYTYNVLYIVHVLYIVRSIKHYVASLTWRR